MRNKLHDALENCLILIQNGADPDQALSLYPDLADELREPLFMAVRLSQMNSFEPSQQDIRTRRQEFLAQFEKQHARPHKLQINWPRLRPAWALGLVVSVLAVSSVLTASAQALPGGALYPIKRAMERLRYALTISDQSQADLEEQLRHERIDEAQALIEGGLQSTVSLQGQVDHLDGSLIIVDGLPIQVPPDWEDLEMVRPGGWVAVEGRIEESVVVASSAAFIPATWTGRIESMEGAAWIIDGRAFVIDAATAGRESLEIGDLVTVAVAPDIQGQWRAASLTIQEGDSFIEALSDLAQEANLRVASWTGQIVSIHPTWMQIGLVTVRIGEGTEIDSNLQPGDWVTVEARWDGDWWALELEAVEDQDFDLAPDRELFEDDEEDELEIEEDDDDDGLDDEEDEEHEEEDEEDEEEDD